MGSPGTGRGREAAVHVCALTLAPWLLFTIAVHIFTYAYNELPGLAIALTAATAFLAFFLVVVGTVRRTWMFLVLGFLSLAGVGLGAVVGLYIDEEYMQERGRLENGAAYANVDPLSSAATHQDAAVVEFEAGSFIDTWRTIGHMEGGEVYCVAPISGLSYSPTVQYWATGVGCCGPRRDFACGDVRSYEVHGGGVVPDPGPFRAAARQAVIAYGLEEGENALFLRWVRDPLQRAELLMASATSLLLLSSGLYLAVSLILGILAHALIVQLDLVFSKDEMAAPLQSNPHQ